ncbi:hypothetical protein SLS55_003155 [Diplodia seriata]|uniref:Uncharacterized protein n=1 Tax=Diplodia seriata TaxID=420778 RepID=A0ABR3CM89_9PEZI
MKEFIYTAIKIENLSDGRDYVENNVHVPQCPGRVVSQFLALQETFWIEAKPCLSPDMFIEVELPERNNHRVTAFQFLTRDCGRCHNLPDAHCTVYKPENFKPDGIQDWAVVRKLCGIKPSVRESMAGLFSDGCQQGGVEQQI